MLSYVMLWLLHLEFPRETASSEVRGEGREPLADKAGESTLLSRSGGVRALLFIPGVPCARDTTEAAEGGGAWAGVLPICRPDFYTHSPGIFWGSGSTVKLQMPRLSGGQPSLLHLGVLAETAPPNPGHRPLSLRFSLSQGTSELALGPGPL